MWYYHLYNMLYVLTNEYGKRYNIYNSNYKAYDWTEAGAGSWFALIVLIALFGGATTYLCWDLVVKHWVEFRDRKKIKTITIKINGKDMSPYKVDKLTDDVNEILMGKRLPQILETHKLSADDIISMSTVPMQDCFLFTIWYK